ncbi:PhoX family protein [Planctomonas psychrotolerans]|uniref:PhoX family protein n=1 Tax=Planctomonas psychrotolerans TaxID=2528712 RepID=UPI0012393335|nr:PhoX family phosphatase [Planctomonas psychrotolerans]
MPQQETRLSLPMAGHVKGKRSAVTCQLKCGNACAMGVCNQSDNAYFKDIAGVALTRRSMLMGAGAGALALTFAVNDSPLGAAGAAVAAPLPGLRFSAIPPVDAMVDDFVVPSGFQWTPIIRWGDPILPGAPEFDIHNQTPEAQALQFGYNNDYLDILVTRGHRARRGLLVTNHEYTNPAIMFPPAADEEERLQQLRITMAAHGMAVVGLERTRRGRPWTYSRTSEYNRRITAHTPFRLTGPAAGHDLMKTQDDPTGTTVLGTIGNCAGGTTPWGTVLSGEENFNNYFRSPGATVGQMRYGLSNQPSSYGWEAIEPRFDAVANPGFENEPNRFGYIVEIDPHDPTSTPVKHTAMGRMKHEGANVTVAPDGRVVAYMGDDERFDYLYKFVSHKTIHPGKGDKARAHNKTILETGDLYVARFSGDSPAAEITGDGTLPSDGAFDGSGQWIPLTLNGASAVPGFTVEEVLVHTRLAADAMGATKMDRPEDVEPHPTTGKVYVACTNNTQRGTLGKAGVDEVNPRTINRDGHVIEITEARNDATSTSFAWNILLVCGDPAVNGSTYFSGFPTDQVSPISCPDNLAFDGSGNLWISTDGQPNTIGYNDGLFRVGLEGANRGRVDQFLAVPREAETCGPVIWEDERMVYVAVQHPGEDGTFADQHSHFPDYTTKNSTGTFAGPRPSVVQVWKG